MSKAFTKEDQGVGADFEPTVEPRAVPGKKNYITPSGFQRMRREIKDLLDVERPKIVETVAWAASLGDRSENADYIYGKKRLREIDRRLHFLQKRLEIAEVVDPTSQGGSEVRFGATVKVETEEGDVKTYHIVGVDEIDAKVGKISWMSPIGMALLSKKVGDTATFKSPKGKRDLTVLSIVFEMIE